MKTVINDETFLIEIEHEGQGPCMGINVSEE